MKTTNTEFSFGLACGHIGQVGKCADESIQVFRSSVKKTQDWDIWHPRYIFSSAMGPKSPNFDQDQEKQWQAADFKMLQETPVGQISLF